MHSNTIQFMCSLYVKAVLVHGVTVAITSIANAVSIHTMSCSVYNSVCAIYTDVVRYTADNVDMDRDTYIVVVSLQICRAGTNWTSY